MRQQRRSPSPSEGYDRRGASPAAGASPWPPRGSSGTTVFVKGLDTSFSEQELREELLELFSEAGPVLQVGWGGGWGLGAAAATVVRRWVVVPTRLQVAGPRGCVLGQVACGLCSVPVAA